MAEDFVEILAQAEAFYELRKGSAAPYSDSNEFILFTVGSALAGDEESARLILCGVFADDVAARMQCHPAALAFAAFTVLRIHDGVIGEPITLFRAKNRPGRPETEMTEVVRICDVVETKREAGLSREIAIAEAATEFSLSESSIKKTYDSSKGKMARKLRRIPEVMHAACRDKKLS